MIKLLSIAALSLITTQTVLAADSHFAGLSMNIGLGSSSDKVDYGGYMAGISSSKTDVASDIQINYGIATGNNWIITLGTSYDLNDRKFGTANYSERGRQTVDAKLKQHWSLFVTSGYLLEPSLMLYGKLAYHGAKTDYSDSATGSGTRNHHGIGYGVGINYALNQNIELGFEVQHVSLSRESAQLSDGKPSFTEAMLRLGYRF